MATQGRPIPDEDRQRIQRLSELGRSKSEIAEAVQVSRPTVYKYAPASPEKKEGDFTD